MNKFIKAVKSAPKRTAVMALAVAGAVIAPLALHAWGPDRVTFTFANPADYVTFNSITDNPTQGDERNFVRVKDLASGKYTDEVNLTAGGEYEVSVFYHNNAKTSLNASGAGIAHGAFMKVQMPEVAKAGQKARLTGTVGATNAKHLSSDGRDLGNSVWDEVYFNNTSSDMALRYVPGSATISSTHYNGHVAPVNGQKMPDSLYTTGAPLGYDALNGELPGCNEYAGYVTFKVQAVQPNFEVQKTVSLDNQNKYAEQVTAENGSNVQFKVAFKNTGSTQLDNVVISDKLPAGMTYVPGTTFVSNSKTNSQWSQVKEDTVTTSGINIGSYAPNGNAYVKFTAKVTGEACGVNTMVNKATATTPNGSKDDDASVIVNKDCKTIQVCDTTNNTVITINENEFDAKKHTKDLSKCDKIKVCVLKTKTVTEIKRSEFDSKLHSTNMSDCQTTPTTPPVTPPTTPTTPSELPATGIEDGIMAIVGAGSLVGASLYYLASRKNA